MDQWVRGVINLHSKIVILIVVDYDNEDETYELGAEGCEYEKEVLVSANTKFRVTYVAPASDMNEIGFVTIEVEYVK